MWVEGRRRRRAETARRLGRRAPADVRCLARQKGGARPGRESVSGVVRREARARAGGHKLEDNLVVDQLADDLGETTDGAGSWRKVLRGTTERKKKCALFFKRERESLGPCRVGEPCPAPLRVAMRSPLPFPCVPDRPYKILLVQVGTLSFSQPLFGVSVLFIYLGPARPSCRKVVVKQTRARSQALRFLPLRLRGKTLCARGLCLRRRRRHAGGKCSSGSDGRS